MGTKFTEVYDKALVVMHDYRLDNLAKNDYDSFLTYLRGLLIDGIPEFTGSFKALTYHLSEETNEYEFDETLTAVEISILAETIVYNWWTSLHNDVLAIRPKLSIREFKQTDISNGIKQRSEQIDKLHEKIQYDITQYQLSDFSQLPFFNGGDS